MDVYWIKMNLEGERRWYLAINRGDEIFFPEIEFSEEMAFKKYKEEFPENEIVGPLHRPEDVPTCRLEKVAELKIPPSQKVVKGEVSVRAALSGWMLQSEPDKDCRWAGSSEYFDPIATFQSVYGTKLQVTYDDKQLVLLLNTEDPTAYKMTKWWPPEVVKKLAAILNAEKTDA